MACIGACDNRIQQLCVKHSLGFRFCGCSKCLLHSVLFVKNTGDKLLDQRINIQLINEI
jgi:hypothetical protein